MIFDAIISRLQDSQVLVYLPAYNAALHFVLQVLACNIAIAQRTRGINNVVIVACTPKFPVTAAALCFIFIRYRAFLYLVRNKAHHSWRRAL